MKDELIDLALTVGGALFVVLMLLAAMGVGPLTILNALTPESLRP